MPAYLCTVLLGKVGILAKSRESTLSRLRAGPFLRFLRLARSLLGSGIETAWDELATLEEVALAKTIHGKHPVRQIGENA